MADWKRVFVRAAGVAFGVTTALVVIVAALYWWNERPKQWSEKALIARARTTELASQQVGEELVFSITYAMTNTTDEDYVLPGDKSGALMSKSNENGSLARLEGAGWPVDLIIPAKQTVEVRFTVPFKFQDYNTSAEELNKTASTKDGMTQEFLDFVSQRLKPIDGTVFFDFSKRYKVALPAPLAVNSTLPDSKPPVPVNQ